MKTIKSDEHQIITRRENGTIRIQYLNKEPSKTQQHFADSVNVNNIMKKYHNNLNNVPAPIAAAGVYGDFSKAKSYQEMLNAINQSEESFGQLPSELRTRFENNPNNLIKYLDDPKNLEESYTLNLRVKPPQNQNQILNEIKNELKTQNKIPKTPNAT